jgi:hypothetical protein
MGRSRGWQLFQHRRQILCTVRFNTYANSYSYSYCHAHGNSYANAHPDPMHREMYANTASASDSCAAPVVGWLVERLSEWPAKMSN